MTNRSDHTRPRHRRRRLLIRLAMFVLLVVVSLAGLGLWAWSTQPSYVGRTRQKIQAIPQAERDAAAAAFENRFTQAMNHLYDAEQTGHRVMPGDEPSTATQHGVTVTRLGPDREQVRLALLPLNVWLHERFNAWLEAQGTRVPQGVGAPVLAVRDGRARVAVPIERSSVEQIVDLTVSIEPADDGQLEVELHRVRLGRLPVPRERILDELGRRMNTDDAEDVLTQWLQDRLVEAVIPVDQTRARRIVDVQLEEDALVLTLVAEARQ